VTSFSLRQKELDLKFKDDFYQRLCKWDVEDDISVTGQNDILLLAATTKDANEYTFCRLI
jgi:hypothetical protein